jgi:hypothetical protein
MTNPLPNNVLRSFVFWADLTDASEHGTSMKNEGLLVKLKNATDVA